LQQHTGPPVRYILLLRIDPERRTGGQVRRPAEIGQHLGPGEAEGKPVEDGRIV
jgi:hypothetical protein